MRNLVAFGAVPFLIGPDKMPEPWKDPGPNNIVWIQAPHCDSRPVGKVIDTVVLHSTVNESLASTTKWFMSENSKVSAHYTIGKDGSIVQHVSIFDRAWHAGPSKDKEGRERLNDFSIGIELVNKNDGKDPYPIDQMETLKNLLFHLKRRFPLKYICSHAYVAVPKGRKSDPAGFNWTALDPVGLEIVN